MRRFGCTTINIKYALRAIEVYYSAIWRATEDVVLVSESEGVVWGRYDGAGSISLVSEGSEGKGGRRAVRARDRRCAMGKPTGRISMGLVIF